MRSVLVTGASGYIGQRLVPALLKRGVRVRAAIRSAASAESMARLGADPVFWSLEAPSLPLDVLTGIDTIFHLAAQRRSFDATTGATHRPAGRELATGTHVLAQNAACANVERLIVASSVAVYGKPWGAADETTVAQPVTNYGRLRLEAENACRTTFHDEPGRLVIARLTETFGPKSPGQLGILRAIGVGQFRIIGSGRALHHMSMVEDVVAGLIACGESSKAEGQVFNLGSQPRSFGEFVFAASRALGQEVQSTPALDVPASIALKLLRLRPAMSDKLHGILDYQLRPRAFPIEHSLGLLGTYTTADFDASVATAARAASER